MKTKQLSIFLMNRSGDLARITGLLAAENINLTAMSIAETRDFGVLRIVCDDTEKAKDILENANVIVKETDVLLVDAPDEPGTFNAHIQNLAEKGISIEYAYSAASGKIVLSTKDLDEAEAIL
jgi:hypothetical protein